MGRQTFAFKDELRIIEPRTLCCTDVLQVENEKQTEHEHSSISEHLRLLLDRLCQIQQLAEDPGEWQEDSGLGLYRAPEEKETPVSGVGQTTSLEQKTTALENIVCVLNREVERSSFTLEAFSRQHRLDQEKIENLTNKVPGISCDTVPGGGCSSSSRG